jgi:hypothetical protein
MVNVFKLLPLNDWLYIGLATALIGYHVVSLERAKHDVRVKVDAQWAQTIADANKKAKEQQDAQQAQIDSLAAASQPQLTQKFNAISSQLAVLTAQVKKPPAVFKSDCVLPPEQVSAYNAIK